MIFSKDTIKIINEIEDYLDKMVYTGCRSIIIEVNKNETDIKFISYEKLSLYNKIINFLWIILFFFVSISTIFVCRRGDGCIRLVILSDDKNLLRNLELYFSEGTRKYSPNIRVLVVFDYIYNGQ